MFWKHIRAILSLPAVVMILVPVLILATTRSANPGWSLPRPLHTIPTMLGLIFMGLGLALLWKTISQFARQGRGTLAPWDPTQKMVVHGVYRHVRNPISR